MRRPSYLVAAALALLGCASVVAPGAPDATPSVPVAPAPTAAPLLLGADALDAEFRTVPPALAPFGPGAPTSFVFPPITEITLADGARAHVIERHDLPVVHLALLLAADRTPASELLCFAMFQSGSSADHALADELVALGVRVKWSMCDLAGLHVVLELAPARLEPALLLLVTMLRDGAPSAASLDEVRGRRLTNLANESLRDRVARAVDGQLYPANDPARDGPTVPAAALARLTLADLARARAARRPDRLTLTLVGDVTLPAVRQVLDRVAARWPAPPGRAPANASATPPAAAHGVVLIADPGKKEVEIGLAFPVAPLGVPDRVALIALELELAELWNARPAQGESPRFHDVSVRSDLEPPHGVLRVVALAPPGGVAAAVKKMFDDLAAVSAAQLLPADPQGLRATLGSRLALGLDGGAAEADRLHFLALRGTVGEDEPLYRGLIALDPAAPGAFARQWLTRERALVVAVGPVDAEKAAIEALGLGKAKIVRAPALAKGASK